MRIRSEKADTRHGLRLIERRCLAPESSEATSGGGKSALDLGRGGHECSFGGVAHSKCEMPSDLPLRLWHSPASDFRDRRTRGQLVS
jgi:hypothetical protein